MHKPAPWMRDAVAAGGEFHWAKQVPWKHNLINLTAAVGLWSTIALLVGWGAIAWTPVHVVVGGFLLGCCFFAHYILIVHECSHNMFLLHPDRAKQKTLNRAIGIVAGGLFFTDYLQHWEKGHTIHHLHPCEDDDPQDKDPLTGWDLYKKYLGLLLIPLFPMVLNPSNQYGFSLKRLLGGLAFWVPTITFVVLFVSPWAALALLVGFHTLMGLNMTKKAQEHGCGLKFEEFRILRSRTYFYWTSLLTSPFNINYHFEHHANFNVPWYALPAYHRKLLDVVPKPLQPYYFHREFLKQLHGTKPLPPDELRPLTWAEEEAA